MGTPIFWKTKNTPAVRRAFAKIDARCDGNFTWFGSTKYGFSSWDGDYPQIEISEAEALEIVYGELMRRLIQDVIKSIKKIETHYA